MKHILQGDKTKLLLGLAFVFTMISSTLADRAARLEADLEQKRFPEHVAQPDSNLTQPHVMQRHMTQTHDALALTASLRND
jgi:hypothetical protein